VRRYEDLLTRYTLRRLGELRQVVVYGNAARRGSLISFNLGDLHPHDVAQYLDAEGIAVRAGHHCAQPLHRKLGLSATVRASLSFYNSEEEVDRLVEALQGAEEFFSRGLH